MEWFSPETFFDHDDRTPSGRLKKAAINRAIDTLMRRQSGLIGYDQLLRIGLSPASIASRERSGELVLRTSPRQRRRPRPARTVKQGPARRARRTEPEPPRRSLLPTNGVFARDSGRLDVASLRWRAVLSGPESVRLGSVSSCSVLDLCKPSGSVVHVLYTGKTWDPPRGVIAHHTNVLPEGDCRNVGGWPCTSAGRSIFDAAHHGDDELLDDLLDRAVTLRLYDERDLRRLIHELQTIPNARRLSAAMGRLDDKSGEFLSKFERKVTRLMGTSKLIGTPVVNVLVDGYRPDLRLPGTRALIECDGRDYHRSLAQILADEQREEILYYRGYEMLRLRWKDVQYEREATLRRIEQFVLANLAPPVPRG